MGTGEAAEVREVGLEVGGTVGRRKGEGELQIDYEL